METSPSSSPKRRRGSKIAPATLNIRYAGAYVSENIGKDIVDSDDDVIDTERRKEKRIARKPKSKLKEEDPILKKDLTLAEKVGMQLKVMISRMILGHTQKHV